jgi:hypothetical protein
VRGSFFGIFDAKNLVAVYDKSMKKMMLMLVAIFWLGTANAQDLSAKGTFGVRFEALPTALSDGRLTPVYPVFGIQLGIEIGAGQWWAGLRVGGSSLLIFSLSAQWELYGRYILENNDSLVLGFGSRLSVQLFLGPVWSDWHALVGYHFASNFYLEALPGVAMASRCSAISPQSGCTQYSDVFVPMLTLGIGFAWRF